MFFEFFFVSLDVLRFFQGYFQGLFNALDQMEPGPIETLLLLIDLLEGDLRTLIVAVASEDRSELKVIDLTRRLGLALGLAAGVFLSSSTLREFR